MWKLTKNELPNITPRTHREYKALCQASPQEFYFILASWFQYTSSDAGSSGDFLEAYTDDADHNIVAWQDDGNQDDIAYQLGIRQ